MLNSASFQTTLVTSEITINAGESLSNVLKCIGMQLVGAVFPSNWTAGNISFYGADGFGNNVSTFDLMPDVDGTSLSIPTAANRRQPFLPYLFICASHIKIACSNPQAETVTIKMVMQPIFQGVHN